MKIDSKETCETVGKGIKHQLMPPGCFVKSELAVLLRKMGALNEVNGPLGKKKGNNPDLWEDRGTWSSVVNVRRCKTKQTCECKADEPGGAAHWADVVNIFSATGQRMGAGTVTALPAGPNLYSLSEEVSHRLLAS